MIWIRTCQECGHKQITKPTPEYKGESWRELKCRRCKSPALDYGSEKEEDYEPEQAINNEQKI